MSGHVSLRPQLASCVRYTLKNILSHLKSSVIMTPDHRMKGRAAWNVLDLVDTMLVHVREPADLLQNSASVNGLSQSAEPRRHSVSSPILYLSPMYHNQENGSWSIQKVRWCAVQVFYLSLVKNVC